MIRLACPGDEELVLQAAAASPGLVGPRLAADWLLHAQNPATPYRIYIADGGAVLDDYGRGMAVCGVPDDPQEVELFLAHQGYAGLLSDGYCPTGWQAQRRNVMLYRPGVCPDMPMPEGFEPAPAPGEIMEVLQSSEPLGGEAVQQSFYAELCSRKNHGLALWWGMREKGALVATAALSAIATQEAYLAGVETRPAARKKGYASALVAGLARHCAAKRVSLVCTDALVPFYERLGFKVSAHKALIAKMPARG